MAVLLITGGTDLDEQVVDRLLGQGDEVRVLEPTSARAEQWRERGAFLARGEPDDPDLFERAAQNVRTVVVMGDQVRLGVVANVLEAGRNAGVDRLVCCAPSVNEEVRAAVRAAPLDHVLLETGRGGYLRRKPLAPARIAEAIDAADDLAGEPRLEIDLTDHEQVKQLRL